MGVFEPFCGLGRCSSHGWQNDSEKVPFPTKVQELRARVDETLRLAQKAPSEWQADAQEPTLLLRAQSTWLRVEVFYLVERTGQSAMSVEGPYVRPTFFKQLALTGRRVLPNFRRRWLGHSRSNGSTSTSGITPKGDEG